METGVHLRHAPAGSRELPLVVRLQPALQTVQRIAMSVEEDQLDIWVFMREEHREDESAVIRLEREYRNSGTPFSSEVHIYPLSEVDAELLPPLDTLLER